MATPEDLPRPRDVSEAMPITVVVGDLERDVAVSRLELGRARADAVLDEVRSSLPGIDRTDLVVDRTGTPAWGAAAGGDLLVGDRLVAAGERRSPFLLGTAGPAFGLLHPVGDEVRLSEQGAVAADDEPAVAVLDAALGGYHLLPAPEAPPIHVNGSPVTGPVIAHGGDVVQIGLSSIVLVTDLPPRKGQLTELGNVFIGLGATPATTALTPEHLPLTSLVASVAARDERLWSVGPKHPQAFTVPVGDLTLAATAPGRPIVVIGPPERAVEVAAAWLLRLTVLHGPHRLGIRFATGPRSSLAELAHRFRFSPHLGPATAGIVRPTVEVAEVGALTEADGDPPHRILLASRAEDVPVGAGAIVDLFTTPAPIVLPIHAVDPLVRLLAPLRPLGTTPASPN